MLDFVYPSSKALIQIISSNLLSEMKEKKSSYNLKIIKILTIAQNMLEDMVMRLVFKT